MHLFIHTYSLNVHLANTYYVVCLLHNKRKLIKTHGLYSLTLFGFLGGWIFKLLIMVQFSSVIQSCPTLCDPMNRSTPGVPVHHQLPEFTQTHVHRVSDAMQPSYPLLSPSPPAPNPSQHQSHGDCSHDIKRCLFLGRKAMIKLDSILKRGDITLPTKVHLVKAMVFPAVMYGCESWTVKKAEC